jgi:uncharacterized protein (DUF2062 family)
MRRAVTLRLARRVFSDLRLEGAGKWRDAVAMGVGAFIGCLPFYGLHLLMVVVIGRLARLNRLKMYLAANISNPIFAPAFCTICPSRTSGRSIPGHSALTC